MTYSGIIILYHVHWEFADIIMLSKALRLWHMFSQIPCAQVLTITFKMLF